MHGDPPPRLLQKAWYIERWGLPEAGGTNDQPAGLLSKAGYLQDIYNAFRSYRNALQGGMAQWEQQNPDIAKMVDELIRARDEWHSKA